MVFRMDYPKGGREGVSDRHGFITFTGNPLLSKHMPRGDEVFCRKPFKLIEYTSNLTNILFIAK